jgi:uncharacterized protein YdeI (YjbR/CyaY-like superfamily)
LVGNALLNPADFALGRELLAPARLGLRIETSRFASLADINKQAAAVKAYIKEAIAVEKSGAEVAMRSVAHFDVPEEFLKRLDDDPELAEAFHALTPGRQKGYLLHFAGAKQSATRTARVEKHAPRILKGLGLDD